jgi:hypothetical protein
MEVSQKTKRTYELQVRTLMEENWGKKSHIRQIIRGVSGFDDKKLGVTSGSGPLTDSVITPHTQRFAASGAQRDIASWEYWWYTAKFTLFQPTWFKAAPFEVPQHTNRNGEVSR